MTCVVCRQVFSSDEDQRAHFRTQFHIENCRRSANQLPPMSNEEYLEFLEIRAREQDSQEQICQLCNKTCQNAEQFQKHLKSTKHQQREKLEQEKQRRVGARLQILNPEVPQLESQTNGDSSPANVVGSDGRVFEFDVPAFCNYEEAIVFRQLLPQLIQLDDDAQDDLINREIIEKRPIIPANCCLFCETTQDDFAELMKHMESEHGFFIPRAQYANQQGIVKLLQTIFGQSRQCIVCDRSFFTLHSLQAHMIATRHCLPDCENFPIMFDEYYDFTPTYPQQMLEEVQNQPEMLEIMRKRPFRVEKGDFQTKFQLSQGGRVFSLKEWYQYRKARVAEWTAIRAQQRELLRSLQKMGANAVLGAKADDADGTQIVLTEKAQNIVDKVNQLADQSSSRYVLRITDDWLQKQCAVWANQPDKTLQYLEHMEIDARRAVVSEGINHFKPHFMRSTLYMRGDKRSH